MVRRLVSEAASSRATLSVGVSGRKSPEESSRQRGEASMQACHGVVPRPGGSLPAHGPRQPLSVAGGGKQRARVGLVRQGRPRCAPCQMEDGILENKTRGLDTIGFIEASAVGSTLQRHRGSLRLDSLQRHLEELSPRLPVLRNFPHLEPPTFVIQFDGDGVYTVAAGCLRRVRG